MKTVKTFTPLSFAFFATFSAATCAANGVDFLDPRNPIAPALAQAIAFPSTSVIVMIVLLKVALMWAIAVGIFFFTLFLSFDCNPYTTFVKYPIRVIVINDLMELPEVDIVGFQPSEAIFKFLFCFSK